MRIVVFSDSHGNFSILDRIVRAQKDAVLFLHLGDGETEFEDLCSVHSNKRMLYVSGNCDPLSAAPVKRVVECEGKILFLTHGHTLRVKSGVETIKQHARQANADIALFGHTHIAHTAYDDKLYLLNPGSVAFPRDSGASYATIDITSAGIAPNIIRL